MRVHTDGASEVLVPRAGLSIIFFSAFILSILLGITLGAPKVEAQGWEQVPLPAGHVTERRIQKNGGMTFYIDKLRSRGYSKYMINFQYENKGLGNTEMKYHWAPENGSSALFGTLSVAANGKGVAESIPFDIGSANEIRVWVSNGAGNAPDDPRATGEEPHIHITDLRLYGLKSAAAPADTASTTPAPVAATLQATTDAEESEEGDDATTASEADVTDKGDVEVEGGREYGAGIHIEPGRVRDDGAQAINRLEVSGIEVRGWDSERKSAVQAAFDEMPEPLTPEEYATWVAARVLADESIVDIEARGAEELTVTYETRTYLLGFIPRSSKVRGVMTENNEVVVRTPWFSRVKKGEMERLRSATAEIGAAYLRSQGQVTF